MALRMASAVRAAFLRSNVLSLAKTCSIGLRSGEYLGRKIRCAPAVRMAWRARWRRGRSVADGAARAPTANWLGRRSVSPADDPGSLASGGRTEGAMALARLKSNSRSPSQIRNYCIIVRHSTLPVARPCLETVTAMT
jgi:hypothetical protein